jgi:hypothetical protein
VRVDLVTEKKIKEVLFRMKVLLDTPFQGAARAALLPALLLLLVPAAFGQSNEERTVTEPLATVASPKRASVTKGQVPLVADLRGVTLGMTTDEVKKALGDPVSADATGMYFDLKNGESLQLQLDANKKVSMIAAMYSGKNAKAPEMAAVLGQEANVEPDAKGRVYKMVRYASSGYWVAYNRTNSGDSAMTTVTLAKID